MTPSGNHPQKSGLLLKFLPCVFSPEAAKAMAEYKAISVQRRTAVRTKTLIKKTGREVAF